MWNVNVDLPTYIWTEFQKLSILFIRRFDADKSTQQNNHKSRRVRPHLRYITLGCPSGQFLRSWHVKNMIKCTQWGPVWMVMWTQSVKMSICSTHICFLLLNFLIFFYSTSAWIPKIVYLNENYFFSIRIHETSAKTKPPLSRKLPRCAHHRLWKVPIIVLPLPRTPSPCDLRAKHFLHHLRKVIFNGHLSRFNFVCR